MEKVESEFRCEEAGQVGQYQLSELTVPPEAVDGSARAWVSVTGDILAPALDNPGSLVRLPTGR